MTSPATALKEIIATAMEELKVMDVRILEVSELTTVTDYMIIASGRSDRQVKAIAENVIEVARRNKISPLGVEGQKQGQWILIDFGDVIAHIMHPTARDYYQLEKLWATGTDGNARGSASLR